MKSSRASATRNGAVLAWQIAVGAIAIAAWQTLVTLGLLDAFFVSRPSDIAKRLSTWVVSGTLWGHLATTLEESLLGLIAFVVALSFGLVVFVRKTAGVPEVTAS